MTKEIWNNLKEMCDKSDSVGIVEDDNTYFLLTDEKYYDLAKRANIIIKMKLNNSRERTERA